MYLFLDTETSGLDATSRRSVQIAWLLTDVNENILEEANYIVRADDFEIGVGAIGIHGITKEKTMRIGKPIVEVLALFDKALKRSIVLVGHNIKFDIATLQNDINAAKLKMSLDTFPQICTMRASTQWCRLTKLNGKSGFKYPKLIELYRICFGENFNGEHNALEDVRATFNCFFKLMKLGVIQAPKIRNNRSKIFQQDNSNKTSNKVYCSSSQKNTGLNRDKYSKISCTNHCLICNNFFNTPLKGADKFAKCPTCGNFARINSKLVNSNTKSKKSTKKVDLHSNQDDNTKNTDLHSTTHQKLAHTHPDGNNKAQTTENTEKINKPNVTIEPNVVGHSNGKANYFRNKKFTQYIEARSLGFRPSEAHYLIDIKSKNEINREKKNTLACEVKNTNIVTVMNGRTLGLAKSTSDEPRLRFCFSCNTRIRLSETYCAKCKISNESHRN